MATDLQIGSFHRIINFVEEKFVCHVVNIICCILHHSSDCIAHFMGTVVCFDPSSMISLVDGASIILTTGWDNQCYTMDVTLALPV